MHARLAHPQKTNQARVSYDFQNLRIGSSRHRARRIFYRNNNENFRITKFINHLKSSYILLL